MQQFNCPFCGMRDQSEFSYVREMAAVPPLDANVSQWQAFVYQRDNPAGAHAEWWHHQLGCRQMLQVLRDTLTHEVHHVLAVRTEPQTPQPARPAGLHR